MVLLASGIAMRKNMHVGVDILLRTFKPKFKNYSNDKFYSNNHFLLMALKGTLC